MLVTSKVDPRHRRASIAGWVGTLADVTAEAGAEAAMADARDKATEASRLKSDFLANMSHEIRTPMNGVIGMTDLLLETDLDTRQRDYAQTVRNSGEALLTIINDILDFSKVEAGQARDRGHRLRPAHHRRRRRGPARRTGAGQGPRAGRGHRARRYPALVRGDPGRVRQVLTNLIGNAIKFTQSGEIVVRVTEAERRRTTARSCGSRSPTPATASPPDKLALVFQPFVQADTSTSRKYGGTGLGLAISSQLVTLMGGDCGVTSELGDGSTFWFTIRVQADAERTRGTACPTPISPASWRWSSTTTPRTRRPVAST